MYFTVHLCFLLECFGTTHSVNKWCNKRPSFVPRISQIPPNNCKYTFLYTVCVQSVQLVGIVYSLSQKLQVKNWKCNRMVFIPDRPVNHHISTTLSKHVPVAFGQAEIWAFLVFGLFHLTLPRKVHQSPWKVLTHQGVTLGDHFPCFKHGF